MNGNTPRFAYWMSVVFIAQFTAACFITAVAAQDSAGVTSYVRFQAGETVAYGLVEGSTVRKIDGDLFSAWKKTDTTYDLAAVTLLVPTTPSKILAVAGNYESHLGDIPKSENPEMFFKVPSVLVPHNGEVVMPAESERVDAEAELVVVIGKRAKDVSADRALDYVLGVTCGNDVSARDWQSGDRQWWRAKGTDTFGPCGPFVVSGLNYDDLLLQLRVNGVVKQKQRTSSMVHNVGEIVSWVSKHVTLEPGDLIYTGTPGKTPALKPGDVVEVELEGVGVLRNVVKAR